MVLGLFRGRKRGGNPPAAGEAKTIWWQVEPTPFWDMPEGERDRLISAYASWLSGLDGRAAIHAFREEETIAYEDLEASYHAYRFYINAGPRDDPGNAGLNARHTLPPAIPAPVRQIRGALLLEGGLLARLLVVYGVPPSLPEAALALLPWDELHIIVEPYTSYDRVRARKGRIEAVARGTMAEYRSVLEAILDEVLAGYPGLHVWIVLAVKAKGLEELEAREKLLARALAALGFRYQKPRHGLRGLYYAVSSMRIDPVRPLIATSASAAVLYPFVSEELAHQDGLFLGFNTRTGSPIVYNPYQMPNYNVVVLGETGSGKSMTGKIYIRRWWRRFLSPIYVIDPSGEYAKVAQRLSPELQVYRADPDAAGLDPVRLHKTGLLDFSTIYEILSDVYGLQRREEKLQLLEALDEAQSMEDLISSGVLREARADAGLFQGEPPQLGSNGSGVVFDLSELRGKRQKVLAGAILAGLLRPRLRKRSLLVVDEGWMWAEYPALMHMLAETSRVGRKYGVNFLFLTQRPADVLRSEAGRTILEQSSTVLLLRLNEASIAAIRDIYMLTDSEEQRLIEARPGEGVLRASHWRLAVYIQPSKTELREFTTRPGEW
ncbi:MAG: DUF87 domain-containing protein [Desulfurococcales archaeon]|nr:DUF87 domain-containing protein [Desulfurococcales archaeon]